MPSKSGRKLAEIGGVWFKQEGSVGNDPVGLKSTEVGGREGQERLRNGISGRLKSGSKLLPMEGADPEMISGEEAGRGEK